MIYSKQRFFPFTLKDLVQFGNVTVQNYIKQFSSVKDLADRIIKDVEYPFHLGQPDDKHDWNAFHGHYCTTIKEDYWQTAEETLYMKKGDCEDSSVAFVSCARALGLKPEDVWEVLGLVLDATTGAVLGGHGWVISRKLPDDHFRLYESTLDIPPAEYPQVIKIREPFTFNTVIYDPYVLYNDQFEDVVKPLPFEMWTLSKKRDMEKHKLIAEAWEQDTKLTKKAKKSILYKVRSKFYK